MQKVGKTDDIMTKLIAQNSPRPLISVIVPVYNVEKYIGKCLDSLINQAYKNLEIIVIDDGSNDSSGKICENYAKKDQRIKVIHQKNSGIAYVRQRGIDLATAQYICFVDGDDYVDANYVKILYDKLSKHNADISIAGHIIEYEKRNVLYHKSNDITMSPKTCLKKLLYDDGVDTSLWGKLFRKSLFNSITFERGQLFEDHAIFYQTILLSKSVHLCPDILYHYNKIDSNSITNSNFKVKKMDLVYVTQKMVYKINEVYPELFNSCQRRLMWAHLSTLAQITKSKHPPRKIIKRLMTYIKHNRRVILSDPLSPRRDKIALISTIFGYNFFRVSWKFYQRRRGAL